MPSADIELAADPERWAFQGASANVGTSTGKAIAKACELLAGTPDGIRFPRSTRMQLEARIARLEHRCRILTCGLIASLLALGVCFLAGASQQSDDSTIRARTVEIVDAQGKVRIQLGRVEDDTYGVVVFGHNGKARSGLMAGSLGGTGVAIISAGVGKPREGIMLMAQEHSAAIGIRDAKAVRAGMFVDEDKQQFQLRDGKQELVFIAPSGDKPIAGSK